MTKKTVKKEKPGKTPEKDIKEEKSLIVNADPFNVLKFVLMTEKSTQFVESQNKLVFVVERKSSKTDIKKAAESAFEKHVLSVNTLIDQKGRKKAFIKFKEPGAAGDIAVRLGII